MQGPGAPSPPVPATLPFTYYRGRVALRELLAALRVGVGDEVAVQAFTCVAVPEGVLACGAVPVWVDTAPNDVNMCPSSLIGKLTGRTRAIVIQHTFGIPAPLEAILPIAHERGIPVIEDCCHTFLSSVAGQRVGTFGVGAFYSFEWGKPLVCGIGGAAVPTDSAVSEEVARRYGNLRAPSFGRAARLELQYAAFALTYHPTVYWPLKRAFHLLSSLGMAEGNYHDLKGAGEPSDEFGLRMTTLTRRRLRRLLPQLETRARHASTIAGRYRNEIAGSSIEHLQIPAGAEVVFNRYPLFVKNKSALIALARRQYVELADWYDTPVHPLRGSALQTVGYRLGSCPNAERASMRIVSLPTHRRVSSAFVDKAVRLFAIS